jgi:hypothetical protein
MKTILNRPVTVIGETTLFGRTVLIIQLASGVITLACAKNVKKQ